MKKIVAICTLLILSCNVEKNKNSNLPGRLGNAELQLKDDPRVDLRIIEAMKPYGLHVNAPMPPVSVEASDEDKLNYLKNENESIQTIKLDATNKNDVEAFCSSIDKIDVLFHAVGFVHHGTILDCDENEFSRSINVNIFSAVSYTHLTLPTT